jgi:hypothetical protein
MAPDGSIVERRPRDGQTPVRHAGAARCHTEAETVLGDIQAMARRVALKMEADGVDHVLLVVAATKRNRAVLREARALLRERFPLDTRAILRELRAGRCPGQGGIVLL